MATMLEIKTEVLGRIYRTEAETPNIDTWIFRVIKRIEDAYPFGYCKSRAVVPLSPVEQQTYELPANLIVHHPFLLKIENFADTDQFRPLIKAHDDTLDYLFTDPTGAPAKSKYYAIEGDSDMSEFRLYPVPDKAYDAHFYGYFYTDISLWDDNSSNYLTNKYPDVVIDGVTYMASEYYSEWERADRAYQSFLIGLNGDPTRQGKSGIIQDEKKAQQGGRQLKVKLAYTDRNAYAKRNILGR